MRRQGRAHFFYIGWETGNEGGNLRICWEIRGFSGNERFDFGYGVFRGFGGLGRLLTRAALL